MKKTIAVLFAAVMMLLSAVPAFAAESPQPSTYKYKVVIVPTVGGDGSYKFTTEIDEQGRQHVYIESIPNSDHTFDHWEIEGPYTTSDSLNSPTMDLVITGDIVCTPYYRKNGDNNQTGPVATATVNKDNSTTSPKTGASDVIPYVVLVLSLAACGAAVFKLVKSK